MRPLFELKINPNITDDLQVDYVAGVDKPAIERNFLAFKQHFAGDKISFDFDDTLSTERGKELCKQMISKGYDVYIISASSNKEKMLPIADKLGIPHSKVFATGNNENKIKKVEELGIIKHYDNNQDVVDKLKSIGEKFVEPNAGESKDDFVNRCIPILIKEGKDQEQATAVCYSMWEQKNFNMEFAEMKEEERIVFGPAMIPNLKIFRKDGENEFDVFFTAETIKDIAVKFFAKGFQNNFNLMHDATQQKDGVVFFQSIIKDDSKGIQGLQGDYPNGTWFLGAKINNDEVWSKIKSGKIKGFSVEGLFSYKQVAVEKEIIQRLKDAYNENLSNEMLLNKIISIVNGTI